MAIITGTGQSDWPHDSEGDNGEADDASNDALRAWFTLDDALRAAIMAHLPGWPADGSAWSLDGAPATIPDLPVVPLVPAEPPPPNLPNLQDAPTAPMLPAMIAPPVPSAVYRGPSPQNTYLAERQAALVASLRSVASPLPIRILRWARAEAEWWMGGGAFRA